MLLQNTAVGYHRQDGTWINNLFLHSVRGGPAGGGFSTVQDLHRFANALLEYELLDQAHTELAMSPKSELSSPSYGFGFQIRPEYGQTVIGHSGGSEGVSTRMDILPQCGFIIVVLANETDVAEPVARTIREIVASFED